MNEQVLVNGENGEVVESAGVANPQELPFDETVDDVNFDDLSDEEIEAMFDPIVEEDEEDETDEDDSVTSVVGEGEAGPEDGDDGEVVEGAGVAGSQNDGTDDVDGVYRVFKSKEDFSAEVNRMFNRRYGDMKHLETAASEYNAIFPYLKAIYGTDDIAAIKSRIADDHAQFASRRDGVGEQEARQTFQQNLEFERRRVDLETREARIAEQQYVAKLEEEQAIVRQAYPKFDMRKVYQENELFRYCLSAGKSMLEAYELSKGNASTVNGGNAVQNAKKVVTAAQKTKRIVERGGGVVGGRATAKPFEQMSDAERDKYVEEMFDD